MRSLEPLTIGNDIVDLHVDEPQLHERYISRVFTRLEQTRIGRDRTLLWLHWAAKEAAYKALKRLMPKLPFIPLRFEFDEKAGLITVGRHTLAVECYLTEEYVHVTCTNQALDTQRETFMLIHRLSASQAAQPSGAARRIMIEEFSRILKLPCYRLSIVTHSSAFPFLLIDDQPSNHVLSLSHHGRFSAFYFSTPSEER